MEAPLVRELLEMKQEIIRQMDITERLTNQAKGNRKSYLETENANIIKQRKLKEEQRQQLNMGLKLDDDKVENVSSIDGDGEVVNEVTVVTEDGQDEDAETPDEEDNKKTKPNKTKNKKNEEGMFLYSKYP